MIYLVERFLFSFFPLFYLHFIFYFMFHPFNFETDVEYYSLVNSISFYIIFITMDLLLSPFIYYHNVFLFLIFHTFFFQVLSLIQYQYFSNILNVFLSSYCTFGFFKFIYLFVKQNSGEQHPVINLYF